MKKYDQFVNESNNVSVLYVNLITYIFTELNKKYNTSIDAVNLKKVEYDFDSNNPSVPVTSLMANVKCDVLTYDEDEQYDLEDFNRILRNRIKCTDILDHILADIYDKFEFIIYVTVHESKQGSFFIMNIEGEELEANKELVNFLSTLGKIKKFGI